MQGLTNWLAAYVDPITLVMNVIIGLVAAFFIGMQIIQAVKNFGSGKAKEGVKNVGFGLIIVAVAALGVGGVLVLGNTIKPDKGLTFENASASVTQVYGAPVVVGA